MIKKFKQKGITWLDVESPSKEDILEIAKEYNLHSLVTKELLTPSHQSRIDAYDQYIYLVLHFPIFEKIKNQEEKDSHELDIILGQDFLITIRYESIIPIEEFNKIFEAQMKLGDDRTRLHAGYLFHHIIKEMYRSLEVGMDLTNSNLKKIEASVFSGQSKELVKNLNAINRHLLDFRWALKTHREILDSMEEALGKFFGSDFSHYTKSIKIRFERVWEMVNSNRETIKEIKMTNDSLLAVKTNELMKILTIVVFVAFPLSVLITTFNTGYSPNLSQDYNFGIIVAITLSVIAMMLIYFKYKKWL